jgi:regulator of sigma E protease
MTTLLAFLATLALLIVVHELGHYAAARWAGVRVLKFSVGFGRPLFKRTDRHGTEWAVAAIPLGGFVKFLDEREDSVAPDQQAYTFNRQPLGKRAIIVAAGPIANFLLAIGLLWILNMHGIPALRPIVAEPPSGTAAALADLRGGDVIVTLNSLSIPDWQTLAEQLLLDNQTDARLEVEDAHGHLRQAVLPREALLTAAQEANPIHALGLYPGTPPMAAVVGAVIADGPAARAGLQVGDRILAVDETLTEDWQGLVQRIRQTRQGDLSIRLDRAGQTLTLSVRPERVVDAGQTITRIGIAPRIDPALLAKMRVIHRYGPIDAATQAIQRTWDLSVFSLRMMGRMLIGEVSLQNISGPISIADYAGQSAQAGWVAFVGFLALISVSLGVLNLLPIPMLDGGHLLYYLIEWVTGRPVSDRLQEQAHRVGMALLLTLMTFAIYNDLTRLLNS